MILRTPSKHTTETVIAAKPPNARRNLGGALSIQTIIHFAAIPNIKAQQSGARTTESRHGAIAATVGLYATIAWRTVAPTNSSKAMSTCPTRYLRPSHAVTHPTTKKLVVDRSCQRKGSEWWGILISDSS
jgi:hypothetical protein